jgi:hypothetical protein
VVHYVRSVVEELTIEYVFSVFLLFPPENHHSAIDPYVSVIAPRCAIALNRQRITAGSSPDEVIGLFLWT